MKCPVCEEKLRWISLKDIEWKSDGYAYTHCKSCGNEIKCYNLPRVKKTEDNAICAN